jgi:Uma2 family endonuclease
MSVPVVTPSFGIRIPDVVWMPPQKWEGFDRDGPVPFVPDLCVEVLLDSDRPRELGRRAAAYFEGGAKEVIVVTPDGLIEFWGVEGRRQASRFPVALSLEPICCQRSVSVTSPGEPVCGDYPQRAAEVVG